MEKASRTPTQATWIGSRRDLLACCHHGRVSGWRLNIRRGAARYVRSHPSPVRISHTPAWRSLSLVADRGADSDKRPDCVNQNFTTGSHSLPSSVCAWLARAGSSPVQAAHPGGRAPRAALRGKAPSRRPETRGLYLRCANGPARLLAPCFVTAAQHADLPVQLPCRLTMTVAPAFQERIL